MKYKSPLQTACTESALKLECTWSVQRSNGRPYWTMVQHLKAAIPNRAAAKVPLLVVLVFALLSNQGLYMGQGYASSRPATIKHDQAMASSPCLLHVHTVEFGSRKIRSSRVRPAEGHASQTAQCTAGHRYDQECHARHVTRSNAGRTLVAQALLTFHMQS